MSLALKLYKSNGVPVTAAVKKLLATANAARDARDWTAAAEAYREALKRDPDLVHIWIQLGHALKESHAFGDAEAAYNEAARRAPTKAEPHLHLGHLRKRQGDGAGASRSYLRAVKLDPNDPDAIGELHAFAARGADIDAADLVAILQPIMEDTPAWAPETSLEAMAEGAQDQVDQLITALKQDGAALDAETLDQLGDAAALLAAIKGKVVKAARDPGASAGPALVFDVSDLMSYFRGARLPTGIQRVQIETITSALQQRGGRQVKVCCFHEHRDEWLEIPPAAFVALCALSLSDGDRAAPAWSGALARLYVLLNMAPPLAFPKGAYLINLGTSWWLQNYFLFVRKAKAEHGIRYVPFVHDLIPVMTPEHCTKALTEDFISWAIGAFEHADFFLVNSEATKADLIRAADRLGHRVDAGRIAVIRLDADIRKPTAQPVAKHALAQWGLARRPFVLFVSTIESRKNHLCAFDAWIQLVRRHGSRQVPKLVCVGNRGWLNDAIYAQLGANETLQDRVVMLSGISDAELALLYRSCLFTLYPSRYEGWGLPVTESLCFGKVPLISDASSLPEAGGPFAVYFESGSAERLAAALERLVFEPAHRKALEAKIAKEFKPRRWQDIAEQIADQTASWAMRPPTRAITPRARLGAHHPIVRNRATRIWRGLRSAEMFRAGDGWWWPDDWGCWTKAQGGRLEIGLPEAHGPLRIYLQLHGLPGRPSGYDVRVGQNPPLEGILRAGEFKWLAFDVPAAALREPVLEISLTGAAVEDLGPPTGGLDNRVVAVGLAGFFICLAADEQARTAFLEAVAFNDLHGLAFNREPLDVQTGAPLVLASVKAPQPKAVTVAG